MKKLNLIAIGLGLFLLQPLHGQTVGQRESIQLVNARKAVEAAEAASTADKAAKVETAQKLLDKIPTHNRAQQSRLQTRLDRAAKARGPVTVVAEETRVEMLPMAFENALKQLENDVRKLRADWNQYKAGMPEEIFAGSELQQLLGSSKF